MTWHITHEHDSVWLGLLHVNMTLYDMAYYIWRLIHMYDSANWHDTFTCVTWRNLTCDMTHLCVTCLIHYTATHCNTLQHTATHCNTLQHSAPHCTTLQHTPSQVTPQALVRATPASYSQVTRLLRIRHQPLVNKRPNSHRQRIRGLIHKRLVSYSQEAGDLWIRGWCKASYSHRQYAEAGSMQRQAVCRGRQYAEAGSMQRQAVCLPLTSLLFTRGWCLVVYVTWFIHTCDVTCLYVWRNSFICVTWLIHTPIHRSNYTCYGVATISRLPKIIGLS